jgi:hypothetical protein
VSGWWPCTGVMEGTVTVQVQRGVWPLLPECYSHTHVLLCAVHVLPVWQVGAT